MKVQKTHTDRTREELLREQLIGFLPRMRRFARGLARDPDRADDLVQESCERALSRLEQFKEGSRLDSWIYRIIYTRWIDRLRRSKTRSMHLTVLKGSGDQLVPSGETQRPLKEALDLKAGLAALPEDHRASILLVIVEGYSYSEAATVMDVPAGTVASRVARARAALNRLLDRKYRDNFRAATSGKNRR